MYNPELVALKGYENGLEWNTSMKAAFFTRFPDKICNIGSPIYQFYYLRNNEVSLSSREYQATDRCIQGRDGLTDSTFY